MSGPEVDVDAFVGMGQIVDEVRPAPPTPVDIIATTDPVRAAIEQERRQHEQLTMNGHAEPVKNVTPVRSFLRAIVYASRSGGEGHIVLVRFGPDGGRELTCTCEAAKWLERRPKGCWAIVDAREILGMEPVE